jgi:hypothetical protein
VITDAGDWSLRPLRSLPLRRDFRKIFSPVSYFTPVLTCIGVSSSQFSAQRAWPRALPASPSSDPGASSAAPRHRMTPVLLPPRASTGAPQNEISGIARRISGFRIPSPPSCVRSIPPAPSRLRTIVQKSRSPGIQRVSPCSAPARSAISRCAPFRLRGGPPSSIRDPGLAPTGRSAPPWCFAPTAKHPYLPFRRAGAAPCAPCTGRLRIGTRSLGPHTTHT